MLKLKFHAVITYFNNVVLSDETQFCINQYSCMCGWVSETICVRVVCLIGERNLIQPWSFKLLVTLKNKSNKKLKWNFHIFIQLPLILIQLSLSYIITNLQQRFPYYKGQKKLNSDKSIYPLFLKKIIRFFPYGNSFN